MATTHEPVVIGDERSLVLSPKANRARRIFLLVVFVIAPLLLILAAVSAVLLWWQADRRAALRAVEKEVARIQAAGEPITTEDLYAYHRPPKGVKDSTRLWIGALDSFDEQKLTKAAGALPLMGTGEDRQVLQADHPKSQIAEAEVFLAQHQETLEALHIAAASGGECRFPVAFEEGMGALLPYVQKMRTAQRLMLLQTEVHAARANATEATESLETSLAMPNALSHQLTQIEQLVRSAMLAAAAGEVEEIVNKLELSDDQLARLAARLQALDVRGPMTEGMLGERAMGYHTFRHLGILGPPDMNGGTAVDRARIAADEGRLTRPGDCLMYLELMGEFIEASRQEHPEAMAAANRAEDRLKQLAGNRNPIERMKYMNTLLILPAMTAAVKSSARTEAHRDLARCLVAAERYRLANDQPPTSLQQLVPQYLPAVPNDPFDGKPLRMVRRGDELVFYSIGEDGKDDGGQEMNGENRPDMVVRLRLAKP